MCNTFESSAVIRLRIETMNGMTPSEIKKVAEIRAISRTDMAAAKREASRWITANKRRAVIRKMACNTIKFIHSAERP